MTEFRKMIRFLMTRPCTPPFEGIRGNHFSEFLSGYKKSTNKYL
jgi:hypothetical protein